jgi:hypothetical protein
MRRSNGKAANRKKAKVVMSERGRFLLERIRRRREELRQRMGLFSDSAELIRQERESGDSELCG